MELPATRLTLRDVQSPRFYLYEDRRVHAYCAPFDHPNREAAVTLVGVCPRPTQLLESYEALREVLAAGGSSKQALGAVKARASFKTGGGPHRARQCL
jgi:hypothetical protein